MPEQPMGGADETDALQRLAVVTVTYNPDLEVSKRQFDEVPPACLHVVFDNASRPDLQASLRASVSDRPNIRMEASPTNVGLAAGLNRGIAVAAETRPDIEFVLLLDQDTEPGEEGVTRLLDGWRRAAGLDPQTGCVGPRLVDAHTGLEHGFHQIRGWRWTRNYPPADALRPVQVASVNGSGTLMPVELWRELGGLDETLFIDHVDTEWSFRVASRGCRLYGIPTATFTHRMGEATWRFWLFGRRVWPRRSPARHYFLFRNSICLLGRNYVPLRWKFWVIPKLLVTFMTHAVMDTDRSHQIKAMCSGFWCGVNNLRTRQRSLERRSDSQ